jgi:uncharacterized membrane protein YhaH (DUF805 family)
MDKLETDYNIIDWWKKAFLKNYANFSGRARRLEFWYFHLVNIIIMVCFGLITGVGEETLGEDVSIVFGAVLIIFYLSLIIPGLAVLARRLHDLNKSGWNFLFYFIPIAGPIILLVWLFTDGDRFTNNYGLDSKNPYEEEPQFDFEQIQ